MLQDNCFCYFGTFSSACQRYSDQASRDFAECQSSFDEKPALSTECPGNAPRLMSPLQVHEQSNAYRGAHTLLSNGVFDKPSQRKYECPTTSIGKRTASDVLRYLPIWARLKKTLLLL